MKVTWVIFFKETVSDLVILAHVNFESACMVFLLQHLAEDAEIPCIRAIPTDVFVVHQKKYTDVS